MSPYTARIENRTPQKKPILSILLLFQSFGTLPKFFFVFLYFLTTIFVAFSKFQTQWKQIFENDFCFLLKEIFCLSAQCGKQ